MTMALSTTNHDLALAGPVGSLDAYIQAVGSISVLSREEEQALSRRFRDEEDLEAARELVIAHLLGNFISVSCTHLTLPTKA